MTPLRSVFFRSIHKNIDFQSKLLCFVTKNMKISLYNSNKSEIVTFDTASLIFVNTHISTESDRRPAPWSLETRKQNTLSISTQLTYERRGLPRGGAPDWAESPCRINYGNAKVSDRARGWIIDVVRFFVARVH